MKGILFITLLLGLFQLTLSCGVPEGQKFETWSMKKILRNQAIVVYGKETERYNPSAEDTQLKNAYFTVYCVLKNDDPTRPIPENIIVEEVEPVNSCSGTVITIGTNIILGLKRIESTGNFRWDEPNITPDGAAFDETALQEAARVCGRKNRALPEGRDACTNPTCPGKKFEC